MGKQETRLEWMYRVVVPKATSLGAAIVVIGALFKIEHLPGAGMMLGVGLITESVIFAMGVFQPSPPPEAHYEWEKAYPELVSEDQKALPKPPKDSGGGGLVAMDDLISKAGLTPDSFKNFGTGMRKLHDSVNQMKDMTGVATASGDYAKSLKSATKSMGDLNKAYGETVTAMGSMTNATKDAKEYHSQVQTITKNLGALNAVYEMELKDANSHLKAMNKFYSNLTTAMESMSDASKESKVFKEQMSSLTSNLTQLNKVYGNMLSAMKG